MSLLIDRVTNIGMNLPARSVILIDIDHTVSDAWWRDGMIEGFRDNHDEEVAKRAPWDQYHMASAQDKPLDDIVKLLRILHGMYTLVGLTARPEKWRQLTTDWLVAHGLFFDHLIMRPDADYRPSKKMKASLALEAFGPDLSAIAFVLDDQEEVLASFAAQGVTCLQTYYVRRS